jgi:hypothetical protein
MKQQLQQLGHDVRHCSLSRGVITSLTRRKSGSGEWSKTPQAFDTFWKYFRINLDGYYHSLCFPKLWRLGSKSNNFASCFVQKLSVTQFIIFCIPVSRLKLKRLQQAIQRYDVTCKACGCETLSLTWTGNYILRVFEIIFVCMRVKVAGRWRKLHDEKLDHGVNSLSGFRFSLCFSVSENTLWARPSLSHCLSPIS